jgi:hypothetical protein
MRLFTIGDSVSQGFMSLAAARTDLSYSTLLARAMGLELGEEYAAPPGPYNYPVWEAGGLPMNIEAILRRLNERYGSNLSLFETPGVLRTLYGLASETKAHYETGHGSASLPAPGGVEFFHNVAVQGFDVADSWLVTPNLCRHEIELAQDGGVEGLIGPSAAFYRTALKVLNPSLDEEYDGFTQLDWLRRHAEGEGVENLIIWLGANNALGTVISLSINQTPNDGVNLPEEMDHLTRDKVRKWNLWHPADFKREYEMLLRKVDEIMQNNKAKDWKVFVGTVPIVTIVPLAKGVGPEAEINIERPVIAPDGTCDEVADKSLYFRYYVWFPLDEDVVQEGGITPYLTIHDAIHIDESVRRYNRDIAELVRDLNEAHGYQPQEGEGDPQRYYVVDLADAMQRMAWRRNQANPTYEFPEYFKFAYPKVNTKYYYVDARGKLAQGGLISLDGVHPSAIAHGLIAHEFIKVMGDDAGVEFTNELDWPSIFANDRLYSQPITLMQWLYEHEELAERVLDVIQLFRRRD